MTAFAWPLLAAAGVLALAGALVFGRRRAGMLAEGSAGSTSFVATLATLVLLCSAGAMGPDALTLALAALSAWMLHGMLRSTGPARPGEAALRVACYACVPLQYGLVRFAPEAMPVVLPLVATLALPLVAVVSGDLSSLGERLALRYQAVMLSVYAVSFAAMADGHALLIVTSALAGSLAQDGLCTLMRRRTPPRSPRLRVAAALLGSAVATGAGGATLAPLVAQPAIAAALVAAAAALAGALGTLTLAAMAHDRGTLPHCGVPARLEAIAFAAPLLWALGL